MYFGGFVGAKLFRCISYYYSIFVVFLVYQTRVRRYQIINYVVIYSHDCRAHILSHVHEETLFICS